MDVNSSACHIALFCIRTQPKPSLWSKSLKVYGISYQILFENMLFNTSDQRQIPHWKWKEETSLFVKVSFWQHISSVSQGQHLDTSFSYYLRFSAVGLKFPKCTALGCDHTCIWTASCFVAEFNWTGNRREQNRSGLWNYFFVGCYESGKWILYI